MSDNNTTVTSTGIGFFGAMFLLFLGLRLTGHIDWAWYWVAAPLWMPLAVFIAVVVAFFAVLYGIGMPIAYVADVVRDRRRKKRRAEWEAKRKASQP